MQLLENAEEQEIYEKFLDLLRRRKTIEDARKLASSVFLEAEEQMLLGAYSGVPQYVEGFISKEDENQDEKMEDLEEDHNLDNTVPKEEQPHDEGHETSYVTLEQEEEHVSNPYDENTTTENTIEPSNE